MPLIPSRTRWGLVLLIVTAGVCGAFQIGKVPPALPELRSKLGISLVVGGWVISAYSAIGALCGVGMGAAGDRFGYRRTVLFGLLLIGAASLLGSAAPAAAWLLASRVIEGLGFVALIVAGPALIFQLARPPDLGAAFGLWSCFMPLGTSLMMLAAPALLARFGWRGVWACNGFLLLAVAGAFQVCTRDLPSGSQARAAGPTQLWTKVRLVASSPGPILLGVAWSMYTMTFMVVMGFLPTLLMAEGHGRLASSALTAAVVAVNMTGALSAGWLIRRRIPRWALMTFTGVVTGLCMLGVYAPKAPLAVRYALCLVFSAVGGLQPACVLGAAPLYAPIPAAVATTNGFVKQCSYVAMVFGPPAAAALATASGGWHNTAWMLTSASSVWVLCALILRKVPPTNQPGHAGAVPEAE